MEQVAGEIPLLEQVTADLGSKGSFERQLTGSDLEAVMRAVFKQLVASQGGVKAYLSDMSILIEGGQGIFSGAVVVEAPVKATIRGDCTLANDESPGRIALVSLNVIEEGGFIARIALKAVNIKEMVEKSLSDPNRALEMALAPQLELRGLNLKEAKLQFKAETLDVSLRGEPKSHT